MLTDEQKTALLNNLGHPNVQESLPKRVWDEEITFEELKQSEDFDFNLQKKLFDGLWNKAQQENTGEAYAKYVRLCPPQSAHIDEASSRANEYKEVSDFEKCRTFEDYEAFINNYPNSSRMAEAQERLEPLRDDKYFDDCMRTAESRIDNDDYEGAKVGYENYIKAYPSGRHTDEANRRIREIEDLKNQRGKSDLIEAIRRNPNAYAVPFLKSRGINDKDLRGILPDSILDSWNAKGVSLNMGNSPEEIPEGFTEVYFWGTTGSGKTCALASILSVADKKGIMTNYDESGINFGGGTQYYDQLSSMFRNGIVSVLPVGTPLQNQYLPFVLTDDKGKKHKIALIEIAGGVFQCFQAEVYNQQIPETAAPAYHNLKKLLADKKNPKIHFFVIDVDNNSMDSDTGVTQKTYLNNAARYMNTQNIFNRKMTHGIYIITTKSDLSNDIKSYLNNNYLSFINGLKSVSVRCELSREGESLRVFPFSIGKVCLKDRCLFDSSKADNIVKVLQDVTKIEQKKSIFNW